MNIPHDDGFVLEAPAQRSFVESVHPQERPLARTVERILFEPVLVAQETRAEHRRERDRDDAGREHRDHDHDRKLVQ
jgi:hypothetical protein